MPIENIDKLQEQLSKLVKAKMGSLKNKPSVIVGYTASYALHVHENIEMKWRGLPRSMWRKNAKGVFWGPRGQAKFLEQPARERRQELADTVRRAVKGGATVLEALYITGLLLQRYSQELVPIDTGNLRASAFTRKED